MQLLDEAVKAEREKRNARRRRLQDIARNQANITMPKIVAALWEHKAASQVRQVPAQYLVSWLWHNRRVLYYVKARRLSIFDGSMTRTLNRVDPDVIYTELRKENAKEAFKP